MKERQAIEKGYSYTGASAKTREELKILKNTKFKGYKVVQVEYYSSKLSRSASADCFYSYQIYAEKKYFTDSQRKDIEDRLNNIEARKEAALEAYNKALAEIDADKISLEERLTKLQ